MYLSKSKLRIISLVLLFVTILGAFPKDVFAHDAYFLQITFNDTSKLFDSSVVKDSASTWSSEAKHLEAQYFDIDDISKFFSGGNPGYSGSAISNDENNKGKDGMAFTFPPIEVKINDTKNDVGAQDIDRAIFLGTVLTSSLNEAIVFVNNGKAPESMDETLAIAQKLATASKGSSFSYGGRTFAVSSAGVGEVSGFDPNGATVNDDNYLQIKSSDGKVGTYVYQLDKGYVSGLIGGQFSYDSSQDVTTMGWEEIVYNATVFAKTFAFTSSSNNIVQMGKVEQIIADFFNSLFTSVRNALGLYSLQELVYNQGERASQSWYYGVMKTAWLEKVVVFYNVFMGIGLLVMLLGVSTTLLKKSYQVALVPRARQDVMDLFQDIAISLFLLLFLFPIINTLLSLNIKFVNLFGAVGNIGALGGTTGSDNWIAQIFYFGITIYYNFVYIVRSISIAILITTAPLFVMMMTIGTVGKMAFTQWLKELFGYVFRQSIDAMYLGVFLSLSIGSRGIEKYVILATCIPLTQFIMKLITGHEGGSGLALKSISTAGAMGAGLATGAGKLANSRGGGKSSDRGNSGESGGNEHKGEGNGSDNTNIKDSASFEDNKSVSSFEDKNKGSSKEPASASESKSVGGGKTEVPAKSFDNDDSIKELGKADKPGGENNPEKVSPNSEGKGLQKYENFKNNAGKTMGVGKAGLRGAIGAGQALGGASMALAMGTSDPSIASQGSRMMGAGLENTGKTVGSLGSTGLGKADGAIGGALGRGNSQSELADSAMSGSEYNAGTGTYTRGSGDNIQHSAPSDYNDESWNDNGSIEIERGASMADYGGVADVMSNGKEGASITYNQDGHDSDDLLNYNAMTNVGAQMETMRNDPALQPQYQEAKEMLSKKEGIDNIAIRKMGDDHKVMASLNEKGLQNLNVQRLAKKGNNIIETRTPEQYAQAGDLSRAHYVPSISSETQKRVSALSQGASVSADNKSNKGGKSKGNN